MRLWHKDLIPYLPKKQLLGQWRECCLIAKNIKEKGSPNHLLVNRIMEYPIEHFYGYAEDVFLEMRKRGFKCNFNKFNQYFKGWIDRSDVKEEELFANWHNDRYLYQCVFNLQEKFDCGGISGEEMIKISHYMTEKEIEKWVNMQTL